MINPHCSPPVSLKILNPSRRIHSTLVAIKWLSKALDYDFNPQSPTPCKSILFKTLMPQKIWQSNLHLWSQLADSPVGLWCKLVARTSRLGAGGRLPGTSVEFVPGAA